MATGREFHKARRCHAQHTSFDDSLLQFLGIYYEPFTFYIRFMEISPAGCSEYTKHDQLHMQCGYVRTWTAMSALQLEALNFNANHPLLIPDTVWLPLNCMYLALRSNRYADGAPHNQGPLVLGQDHARVYHELSWNLLNYSSVDGLAHITVLDSSCCT